MIYNQHLDRLLEVQIVKDFMQRHHFQGRLCSLGGNHSLILYRLPYVVEFYDALIENYLEIYFSDLKSELLIEGNSAFGCSLDIGLQDLAALRARDLSNHPAKDIFLSEQELKTNYLDSDLEALDKLLPLIEAKGGLASMRDGTFDRRFDFSDSVKPLYPSFKERYRKFLEVR